MGTPPSQEHQNHEGSRDDQTQEPPPPPRPENDAGIVPSAKSPSVEEDDDLSPEHIDIFNLKPVSALKLLCRSIDLLVQMTGDVPPTPPVREATKPRSPAKTSFSLERSQSVCDGVNSKTFGHEQTSTHEHIDGVPFKNTPIGSPEAHPWEMHSPPHEDVGYNAQPLYIQHATLARKFYSKRPPPISTEDYLLRMHKYCPMSTAVYLATSYYITRLAVVEKVVPVTPRNVHRMLLAGLRVAMKSLEDLSWPHGRFAKVGGVTEAELGRLEITFCFLTGFILKVDAEELQKEAEILARVYNDRDSAVFDLPEEEITKRIELKLPDHRFRHAIPSTGTRTPEKRKASSALPSRPALHVGAGIEVMGQS